MTGNTGAWLSAAALGQDRGHAEARLTGGVDQTAGPRRWRVRSGQLPLLVGGVGAVPDLQLGAGAPVAGVIQALARLRVVELAVGLRDEHLGTGAVAVVQVDLGP